MPDIVLGTRDVGVSKTDMHPKHSVIGRNRLTYQANTHIPTCTRRASAKLSSKSLWERLEVCIVGMVISEAPEKVIFELRFAVCCEDWAHALLGRKQSGAC